MYDCQVLMARKKGSNPETAAITPLRRIRVDAGVLANRAALAPKKSTFMKANDIKMRFGNKYIANWACLAGA